MLGGTALLHDGDYKIPRNLEEDKSRKIVEDTAEQLDHDVYGSKMPYFSIDLGNGERYDLVYLPTREGLQAVAHYDQENQETLSFHNVDELLEGESTNG